MNIRQKILAGAAIMLLVTGSAWGDKEREFLIETPMNTRVGVCRSKRLK